MRCLEGCEFLVFKKGIFNCGYYTKKLQFEYIHEEDDGDHAEADKGLIPHRCTECIEERVVGSNTIEEAAKKAKFRLGLIGDSFYSFKDDFETELTEIYRILKDLEEKSQND